MSKTIMHSDAYCDNYKNDIVLRNEAGRCSLCGASLYKVADELEGLNPDILWEELEPLCFNEKHPDDMFNVGVADNYEGLSRDQQIEVVTNCIKKMEEL